ncbi:protease modulator HflK [Polymorphobacter multimanifer]|uniref:Protein HflK n=1 Tax=Polymorphobacter multimanifer TaxID=1070431 RepID=A0A841LFH4_9SPHN|nr:FtsH protease activity modulator HflK [Polymorphobacter multimanifer]MBB6228565.1 membrane protease subunit HflK [Polymorphobacter multimanifer]GGI92576.1 protease modulator HflK [Polymorphobacter multimanifer]
MPWQNNNDPNSGGRKPGDRSPADRGPWDDAGDEGGKSSGEGGGSGGGRNPWGEGPSRRPTAPRPSGNRDFDDIIRRGQEKLRQSLPGGGGGGRGFGGGGGGGGGLDALGGKGALWVGAALVAAWLIFSSFYRVQPQERGVVLRFGAYVQTTEPGLHFKLPFPIDSVTLRKVEQINSIDIGAVDGNAENLMITGDQNIITLAYAVRWKINNPEQFLFALANPEQTVREVAESAMRAEIARATLTDAIGPQRAQIAEQVRERIQSTLDSYRSGIDIRGVDIRQADPPGAVDDAFKDVSAAQQDAQQYLNQSRAYAQQLLASAQGATAAFDAVYEQYRLAPEVTRKRMYLETMESVLSKVDKTVIEPGSVTTYLPLQEIKKRPAAVPEPAPAQ